jgi:hypothetical protein
VKVRVRLDTLKEVTDFVRIATALDCDVQLTNGKSFMVNGKSLLGALYSTEWKEVYCECEQDIYHKISEFVVVETPVDLGKFL